MISGGGRGGRLWPDMGSQSPSGGKEGIPIEEAAWKEVSEPEQDEKGIR